MTEAASANGAAPAATVADVVPVEKFHRVQAQVVDLEKKLEQFKDIDPVAFKAIKEDYELMRKQQTGGDPKKIDELVAAKENEIRSTVQKALDALKQENEGYKGKLKELQVTDSVFSKAAAKFNADCHEDVKAYIRKYGDVSDDGTVIFKDDKGAPRYAPGSTTKLMDATEFVGWLAEQKPSWAVPDGKAGAKTAGQKTSAVSGGKILSWAEIGQLPDKGKAYMNNLANTDKAAFNALMQEAKF